MNTKIKEILTRICDNNEYFTQYIQLIDRNIGLSKTNLTYSHHIVPRAYFKLNHISVDNSFANRVNLSAADHILAHYLLYFCITPEVLKAKMSFAFVQMTKELPGESCVNDFEKYNEIYLHRQKYCGHISTTRHHKRHTSDTKRLISEKNSGRYVGDVWMNKNGVNRHVPKDSIQDLLSLGYVIGRDDLATFQKISESQRNNPNRSMLGKKQTEYQKSTVSQKLRGVPKSSDAKKNMREARVGKILISNDITQESFYINKEEIETFLNNGFRRGRLLKRK